VRGVVLLVDDHRRGWCPYRAAVVHEGPVQVVDRDEFALAGSRRTMQSRPQQRTGRRRPHPAAGGTRLEDVQTALGVEGDVADPVNPVTTDSGALPGTMRSTSAMPGSDGVPRSKPTYSAPSGPIATDDATA
jgi:hypothetical protein